MMPASEEGDKIREKYKRLMKMTAEDFALERREMQEVNAYNHLQRSKWRITRTLSEIKKSVKPKIVPVISRSNDPHRLAAE